MTEPVQPTKNIPIYQGEEGDTSTQVGWASLEADGVYATDFFSDFTGDVNNVWYGEEDPNAPVPTPVEVEEPVDSEPIEVPGSAKKK